KRERRWPWPATATPAWRFVAALGGTAPQFERSLAGLDRPAETQIVAAPQLLVSGEGGVLHYRNAYPDARPLRFWAGLVLLGQRRFEAAARELLTAVDLGLSAERIGPYLTLTSGPSRPGPRTTM